MFCFLIDAFESIQRLRKTERRLLCLRGFSSGQEQTLLMASGEAESGAVEFEWPVQTAGSSSATMHSVPISSQLASASREPWQRGSRLPVCGQCQLTHRGLAANTGCLQLETLTAEAAAARSSLLLTAGSAARASCQTRRRQLTPPAF